MFIMDNLAWRSAYVYKLARCIGLKQAPKTNSLLEHLTVGTGACVLCDASFVCLRLVHVFVRLKYLKPMQQPKGSLRFQADL